MQKRAFERLPAIVRYITVTGSSLLFSAVCCLIMSAVAMSSDDPTADLWLYGRIIFVLSMLFCGFVGAKAGSGGRLLCGILSSLLLLATVISAAIALGNTNLADEALVATVGAAVAVVGALIGSREKKRKRRQK